MHATRTNATTPAEYLAIAATSFFSTPRFDLRMGANQRPKLRSCLDQDQGSGFRAESRSANVSRGVSPSSDPTANGESHFDGINTAFTEVTTFVDPTEPPRAPPETRCCKDLQSIVARWKSR